MNDKLDENMTSASGRSRLGLSVALGIMAGAISGVLLNNLFIGLGIAVGVALVSVYGTARLL